MKNVLHLPIKREYFEAIERGEKLEEYRLVTPYWERRLLARDYDEIVITLGYPKRSDTKRRMRFRYNGFIRREITHPHFGLSPVRVFAINLRERLP